MNVEISSTKRGYSIKINSDCDFFQAQELVASAMEISAKPKNTVVDWSEAKWIHFAGLQVLISLGKQLKSAGKTITFSKPSQELESAFNDYGLNVYFAQTTA